MFSDIMEVKTSKIKVAKAVSDNEKVTLMSNRIVTSRWWLGWDNCLHRIGRKISTKAHEENIRKTKGRFQNVSLAWARSERMRTRITGILHFLLSQPSQTAPIYSLFSNKNQGVIIQKSRRFLMKSPTSLGISPTFLYKSPISKQNAPSNWRK